MGLIEITTYKHEYDTPSHTLTAHRRSLVLLGLRARLDRPRPNEIAINVSYHYSLTAITITRNGDSSHLSVVAKHATTPNLPITTNNQRQC